MNRNNLRSQSLDLLRFPLAVVVVIIHIFSISGFAIHGVEVSLDNMPVFDEVKTFIAGFLKDQSVPVYFFISGFVFFWGVELTKEKYVQKLKNRVKSLLIPYIIWNILFVVRQLLPLLPCLSAIFPNGHSIQLDLSLSAILNTFWNDANGIFMNSSAADSIAGINYYPADAPLWFVRDLMIVVLCAPVLYWILKRTRQYFVILLGIIWFAIDFFNLFTAFFFFSWGAYMSINAKDLIHEFRRFFKPSLLLYPTLGLLFVASAHYFPQWSEFIKKLNVFVGLIFAYNISAWLLTKNICKVSPFLASSSFFIYVSHFLICTDAVKVSYCILKPSSDLGMLAVYCLATVLTVSILLATFYLLKRFTPKLLSVIAGRK